MTGVSVTGFLRNQLKEVLSGRASSAICRGCLVTRFASGFRVRNLSRRLEAYFYSVGAAQAYIERRGGPSGRR